MVHARYKGIVFSVGDKCSRDWSATGYTKISELEHGRYSASYAPPLPTREQAWLHFLSMLQVSMESRKRLSQ